ncbi:MAG: UbiA family prenyltransferase [Thermoplasmatota archaeon]
MYNKKSSKMLHPFIFLSQWRSLPPFELISYVLMFASMPMLAYGIIPYDLPMVSRIIFSILSLYSGFFAALIWNDITDADIDCIAHPDRPVPSGRISKKKFFTIALLFSFLTFFFALLINIWCLFLVGMSALFVTFHNKYLKKMIKLPAYSEIFTPIQWIVVVIFGFFTVWTMNQSGSITIALPIFGDTLTFTRSEFFIMILLVIFTYFTDNAHDLPEGIHDYNGDMKAGVKTYATSFGKKNAARISFSMYILSGVLGVLIYYYTTLSFMFLIPFIFIWLYTISFSYRLLKADESDMSKFGSIVGRKGFNFLLISFDLIFIDICLQLILTLF